MVQVDTLVDLRHDASLRWWYRQRVRRWSTIASWTEALLNRHAPPRLLAPRGQGHRDLDQTGPPISACAVLSMRQRRSVFPLLAIQLMSAVARSLLRQTFCLPLGSR